MYSAVFVRWRVWWSTTRQSQGPCPAGWVLPVGDPSHKQRWARLGLALAGGAGAGGGAVSDSFCGDGDDDAAADSSAANPNL